MEKEKQEKLGKKLLFWCLGFLAEQVAAIIISIILAFVLCINATPILGYFNIGEARIKVADEARINNNYSDSIEWYKSVIKSKKESYERYKPYANLALAEIYSLELDIKSYSDAFAYYKAAINGSTQQPDIRIYHSALRFIALQIEKNNAGSEEELVDIYDDNKEHFGDKTTFVDFAIKVLTVINQEEPISFSQSNLSFPISKSEMKSLFGNESLVTITNIKWIYTSTIINKDPDLGKCDDNEKIVFVEQWQELNSTSESDASTNTFYKYFRYQAKKNSKEITFVDYLYEIQESPKRIRLTDLKFDKNNQLITEY